MIILPAIDLKNGRCVRLSQGRADQETIYGDDPVAQALEWEAQGAQELHVVDLDGAFTGEPKHTAVIAKIVETLRIPVEVGGGLRTADHVASLMDIGVARAIIGTGALADTPLLESLVKQHGERIAVGIDARDGLAQVKGWVETTAIKAVDLAHRVAGIGISTIIYTDTATDGMLSGTNIPAMREMCALVPECSIIASGGISAPEHVRSLKALSAPNLYGAIVGKALYDRKTTLAAMMAAARE